MFIYCASTWSKIFHYWCLIYSDGVWTATLAYLDDTNLLSYPARAHCCILFRRSTAYLMEKYLWKIQVTYILSKHNRYKVTCKNCSNMYSQYHWYCICEASANGWKLFPRVIWEITCSINCITLGRMHYKFLKTVLFQYEHICWKIFKVKVLVV